MPPTCQPEKRKPEVAGTFVGVKQMRWSPEVSGGEGDFAAAGAALGDYAVVVVKCFVHCYEHALGLQS